MRWIDTLKDYYALYPEIGVVEVHFISAQHYLFSFMHIKQQEGKASIVFEEKNIEALEQLFPKIPHSIPLLIRIGGRGILEKFSPQGLMVDIQQLFPAVKMQEVYVQRNELPQGAQFYIVRKDQIDPILQKLTEKKWHILSISAGPLHVLPFLSVTSELKQIHVGTYTLLFQENALSSVIKEETISNQELEIAGEKIANSNVFLWTLGLSAFLSIPISGFDISSIQHSQKDYEAEKKFKTYGISALVVLFVLLLINTYFFQKYTGEIDRLNFKLSGYSKYFAEIDSLDKEFKIKKSGLEQSGWMKPSVMTKLSNTIALTVPSSIRLTQLAIAPKDERKSRELRYDVFLPQEIKIMGISNSPNDIEEWLVKIQAIPEITQVQLKEYQYQSEKNRGEFTVMIQLKK